MADFSISYDKIEVTYIPRADTAALPSDGDLVQAVPDPDHSGPGVGKATPTNLSMVKHTDQDADSFDFVTDTGDAAAGHDGWIMIETMTPPIYRSIPSTTGSEPTFDDATLDIALTGDDGF